MSWVAGGELEAFLQGAGLISAPRVSPETLLDLEGALASAQEAFEARVNWRPFLQGGADSTRFFDAPKSRLLDLQGGLLSVASVTVSGVAQVVNSDYFLMPENASLRGLPSTYLEFSRLLVGGRRAVAVTGRWGRVSTLPEDARQAVLAKASVFLAPQLQGYRSQGLSRWQEGDVEQWSGAEPFGAIVRGWEAAFEMAVRRYRRAVVA
jgi:hypothetical protein